MRVGYLLDPDGQVSTTARDTGDEPLLLLRHAGRAADLRGLLVPRVPLPADRRPRPGDRARARSSRSPGMPPCPRSRWRPSPPDDRMLDAVWKLNARSCLYCCHEQFVDTPTREKAQFLWDAANESEAVMRTYGDQNLSWQGSARRGPRPGPLLARRPGQRGVPLRRSAHATSRPSPSATPSGSGATTSRRATRTPRCALYPTTARRSRTSCGRHAQPGTGLLYGLADVPER